MQEKEAKKWEKFFLIGKFPQSFWIRQTLLAKFRKKKQRNFSFSISFCPLKIRNKKKARKKEKLFVEILRCKQIFFSIFFLLAFSFIWLKNKYLYESLLTLVTQKDCDIFIRKNSKKKRKVYENLFKCIEYIQEKSCHASQGRFKQHEIFSRKTARTFLSRFCSKGGVELSIKQMTQFFIFFWSSFSPKHFNAQFFFLIFRNSHKKK